SPPGTFTFTIMNGGSLSISPSFEPTFSFLSGDQNDEVYKILTADMRHVLGNPLAPGRSGQFALNVYARDLMQNSDKDLQRGVWEIDYTVVAGKPFKGTLEVDVIDSSLKGPFIPEPRTIILSLLGVLTLFAHRRLTVG